MESFKSSNEQNNTERVEADVFSVEELSAQVEVLREQLQTYDGANLSGATLAKADHLALTLMNTEALLREAQTEARKNRTEMPVQPPADYLGNVVTA